MNEAAALLARIDRLRTEITDTKSGIRRSRQHLNNLRGSLARTYARAEELGLTDDASPGEEGKGDLHGHPVSARS